MLDSICFKPIEKRNGISERRGSKSLSGPDYVLGITKIFLSAWACGFLACFSAFVFLDFRFLLAFCFIGFWVDWFFGLPVFGVLVFRFLVISFRFLFFCFGFSFRLFSVSDFVLPMHQMNLYFSTLTHRRRYVFEEEIVCQTVLWFHWFYRLRCF